MAQCKAAFGPHSQALAVLAFAAAVASAPAAAQKFPNYPITPGQRTTAQQVHVAGIPLSEIAPNAPDTYRVKVGDTLWGVSRVFLRSPWRWPELWGMNLEQVNNPHLIYPGQLLALERGDGLARLHVRSNGEGPPTDTERLSPRARVGGLPERAIAALPGHVIEAFLAEPLIVDEDELLEAPRIVAGLEEERVLVSRGDRAYVRGRSGKPLVEKDPNSTEIYRVFRDATPLKDPHTGKVLGYEAKYLGRAELVRSESEAPDPALPETAGASEGTPIPATVDIIDAKEEMWVGDRLLPEPPKQSLSYVPRAPQGPVDAAIVSIYGNAMVMAGQYQVVTINKGTADGMAPGHVLAVLSDGRMYRDRSQSGEGARIKLPNERNGFLMVFRPFERVSYALVLNATNVIKVGDRVANPR